MIFCPVRAPRSTECRTHEPAQSPAADLSDDQLTVRLMSPLAMCACAVLDPDEWFPVATVTETARAQARGALALCAACPVRAECLEFAMRNWRTIGRHGIWGGLVEAERAAARRSWAAGIPVETLLRQVSQAAG